MKAALRGANAAANSNRPEISSLKLETSVKKNTGFIKKLVSRFYFVLKIVNFLE